MAGREFSAEMVNRKKTGELFHEVKTISPIRDEAGNITHLVATGKDITEHKGAEEKIRRQVERLSALHELDVVINGSSDLRVSLHMVVSQICKLLNVDAADILRWNPHTKLLEYVVSSGFHSQALQLTRLRLGEGIAGKAARELRTIFIDNLSEVEEFQRSPLLPSEKFVSYIGVPLVVKGNIQGVLEVFSRTRLHFDREWMSFLQTMAEQAAIAMDNISLLERLERTNQDLTLAYDETIEGWSHALDLRDRETEGHTRRVTELTMRLARAMQIPDEELVHIRRGALLHDIGKMGIPDSILHKPGPLTSDEWVIMRKHTEYAYEMIAPIDYLRPAIDIPYCHHERWDGSGYPRGLKGKQIPLPARIFAVIDVWDALTSDRPYRPAWTREKTLAYIREQSGSHFDPEVVEKFLALIDEQAWTLPQMVDV